MLTSTATRSDGETRVSLILSPDLPSGFLTSSSSVIQKAATLVGDALETADEAWIGDTATAWVVLHWRSIRGLVTRNVEPHSLVAGNPARFIRKIDSQLPKREQGEVYF